MMPVHPSQVLVLASVVLPSLFILQSCKTVEVFRESRSTRQEFVYVTYRNQCVGGCTALSEGTNRDNQLIGYSADSGSTNWDQQKGKGEMVRTLCRRFSIAPGDLDKLIVTGKNRILSSEDWIVLVDAKTNRFTPDKRFLGTESSSSGYIGNCIGKKYLMEVDNGIKREVVGTKQVPFWDNSSQIQTTNFLLDN